jgi:hypothetical protein
MTLLLLLALTATLVAALERHHRRTWRLPHAPLGADASVASTDLDHDLDHDLDRVLHDVGAAAH